MSIAESGEIRVVRGGDRQSLDTVCPQDRGEIHDFFRTAGIAQQKHDILWSYGSQIAMHGIRWMKHVGWDSDTREGR